MVELFPERLERGRDVRVVHHPAQPGIVLAFDDDLDLEAGMAESVTVVEWGTGIAEWLSDDRLEISIDRHADDTRTVQIRRIGDRWRGTLTALAGDKLE